MPEKAFATQTHPTASSMMLSSDKLYEINQVLIADEISPEYLAYVVGRSTATLLYEASRNVVALDWETFRSHIHQDSLGPVLITRVDVL